MSDASEAPGWWLASDGRWYPPELWRSYDSYEKTAPTAPGGPLPRRHATQSPKKLPQRWWPWATIGLVVLVVFVTLSGILVIAVARQATENRGQAAPRYANGYPLGTTAEFTQNGKPLYSVTATHFVNPAKAWLDATPQNAGDIFVAVEFTIRTTGSSKVSDDIWDDARMYDSGGKSYFGSLEGVASGPNFPSGTFEVVPGASERGWAIFEVPGSVQVTKITFTPSAGSATQAAVSWSLPYWPRLGCEVTHACSE